MRITNQMMTNSMMNSINKNKNNLSDLDAQYASGKKIQRPSEDPIIAVRALKLRTNLAELNQYYEKNIPDAMSWMDLTEGALTNIEEILKNINTACVQGASDPLGVDERESIIKNLEQYKEQIYQEGNTNYAGRYVFTGYKTDTGLMFDKPSTDLEYTITENFSGKNIESISKVSGTYSVDNYNPATDYSASPTMNTSYRIRLSYDNLDLKMPDGVTDVNLNGKVTALDKNGASITVPNITTKSASDPAAYQPTAGEINYIPETGELILSDGANAALKNADSISVDYRKTKFKEGDLRPEHYFDSDVHLTGSPAADDKHYTKQDQEIQYEINFNQKLTINTQGSDAIQHNIGRDIDEILMAVQDVKAVEKKLAEVDKMLADPNYSSQVNQDKLNQLKQQLNTEHTLKNDIMQKKFGGGITHSSESLNTVSVAKADLGSRYVRLQLTESRLSDQQVEFTDLMSKNEDVDMVETYIKYNSAEVIYNASLSAASKIVKNTLMDFL
jgi:flagellar hook-associated protein 3 FlgL